MHDSQHGFTLIELVVVIAIIGIMSAFALPRMFSLQTDARITLMLSTAGALRNAAALGHSMLILRGYPSNYSGSNAITVEDMNISYENGYPDAASALALSGINQDFFQAGTSSFAAQKLQWHGNDSSYEVASDARRPRCKIVYTSAAYNKLPIIDISHLTHENCR